MPRYEFSEGSSNKFWQIDLSGKSFTTTYGKIGTAGQTTIKTWKTEAEAKKEYDKLIAEKVKKGYEPAGGGGEEDVDEDEEEIEEEEEEAPAKKSTKTKAAVKPAAKTASKPAAKAAPAKAAPAKATAKAAPAKAAPKAAANDRSTPRYFEFSEGTSNKFWQIWMDGTSVLTKYGRIGAAGSTTVKDFGDDAKATKEYDKLLNEKTKKGYEEKDMPGGGGDDDEDMDDED
jgi:predicted DNA-binding WGR domain protein